MKKFWKFIPLIAVAAIMLGMSSKVPMWMDEYVFYRLSLGLPKYEATADWFFKDRPDMLNPTVEWGEIDKEATFRLVYDTPIYPHTPLMPIVMSPVVKGLDALADNEVIPHIEEQAGVILEDDKANRAEVITFILRLIPIAVFLLTLWLIFKLMFHKVGNHAYAMWIPIAAGMLMLQGAYLFYWDVFMMFFFVLTLYLMEVHPNSKWKYVTACALVNTKMFLGIAFLFPLFVNAVRKDWKTSWKMLLPVLSIIPFYVATLLVMHDPLYLFKHYMAQVPIHNFIYTLNTPLQYMNIIMTLGMPVYLIIGVLLLLKGWKHLAVAVFFVMGMFYAWATGLGLTHTTTMLYAGALAAPLVSYEWNLLVRGKKLLGIAES